MLITINFPLSTAFAASYVLVCSSFSIFICLKIFFFSFWLPLPLIYYSEACCLIATYFWVFTPSLSIFLSPYLQSYITFQMKREFSLSISSLKYAWKKVFPMERIFLTSIRSKHRSHSLSYMFSLPRSFFFVSFFSFFMFLFSSCICLSLRNIQCQPWAWLRLINDTQY